MTQSDIMDTELGESGILIEHSCQNSSRFIAYLDQEISNKDGTSLFLAQKELTENWYVLNHQADIDTLSISEVSKTPPESDESNFFDSFYNESMPTEYNQA